MPQVFVKRAQLLNETPTDPVVVLASYRNDTVVDPLWHGPDATVMSVPDTSLFNDRDHYQTILASNWRDDYVPVVNAESARRITKAFPDYKQSNYNAQYNNYQSQYGVDTTQWPVGMPQDFLAEYLRGWKYVNDVRAASNNMTGMPQDPTADEHWPPAITPIT